MTGTFHQDLCTYMSPSVFLKMRNVSNKSCKKHYFILIFFLETRAVYDITWRNTVEQDGPHATIYHGSRALHTGYLRLQTYNQNMWYLFLFHGKIVRRMRLKVTYIPIWHIQWKSYKSFEMGNATPFHNQKRKVFRKRSLPKIYQIRENIAFNVEFYILL
jgi:hypothetical protein